MKPLLLYLCPLIGLFRDIFALTIARQNITESIGLTFTEGCGTHCVAGNPMLLSLAAPMRCPNFDRTDPTRYFGPDLIGSCRAMQWLKCGAILVECGAVCIAATGEEGFNPWADFACQACVGTAAANACNVCWNSANGRNTLCMASQIDPDAKCLAPFCRVGPPLGRARFNPLKPPPVVSGGPATS